MAVELMLCQLYNKKGSTNEKNNTGRAHFFTCNK